MPITVTGGKRRGPSVPVPVINELGPIGFNNFTEARAALNIPANANIVSWNDGNWTNLEQAFRAIGTNDILGLPQRGTIYPLLSDWGFPTAGVSAVRGLNGVELPVSPTWNGLAARTWWAMSRAQRGIVGLGPDAVIEVTESAWSAPEQIQDAGSVESNGWVSTGRYYRDTNGVLQGELVGAQEKLIESQANAPYFGNFTLRARDLGGIAYHGIALKNGGTAERIFADAGWRGSKGVPNSETGAITCTGGSGYFISRCNLKPVDSMGARVGSSPIMINSSGGGRIEHINCDQTRVGMPTLWNVSGRHEIVNVSHKWGIGPGLNLERVQAGAHIYIEGGAFWPNRGNNGGKGASPDGIFGNALHISLGAEGPLTLEVRDLDYDKNAGPLGTLSIQGYAQTPTWRDSGQITVINTLNGASRPYTIY